MTVGTRGGLRGSKKREARALTLPERSDSESSSKVKNPKLSEFQKDLNKPLYSITRRNANKLPSQQFLQ